MAERIMMTPQELNDGAVFLRERMEAMNEEVASLRNRIEDVASSWEGAAQESFIEQFMGDMYPILSETLPQIVEGLASELDAAANAIRETDESLASAFRG